MVGLRQGCVQADPPGNQHEYHRLQVAQLAAAVAVVELVVVGVEKVVLRKNLMHFAVVRLQGAA